MYRYFLMGYIISVYIVSYLCSDEFRQERAKLKYYNPKYIEDVVVLTRRKSRNDPYLSSMAGTILMPYGNNVSYAVTLTLSTGGDFRLEGKACDSVKYKWTKDFLSSFTNISFSKCPLPSGRYSFKDMELPPRNIPLPLADGDYWIRFELLITATKESIVEANTLLHFDKSKGTSNNNKKKKT